MLGWDKAVEAVANVVRRLGFKDGELGPDERQAILEDLALEAGLVGVTARYVLSRRGLTSSGMKAVSIPPSSPHGGPDSTAAARLVTTVGVHEVVSALAPLLGADRCEGIVLASMKKLGLPRERLDREQATRLLDELSRQEGHVGSTARFARPRVLALFGG